MFNITILLGDGETRAIATIASQLKTSITVKFAQLGCVRGALRTIPPI
ncbi:MAG: hypothetical protein WBA39_32695 [Rivularia sp. (in: cyanobacteria)]